MTDSESKIGQYREVMAARKSRLNQFIDEVLVPRAEEDNMPDTDELFNLIQQDKENNPGIGSDYDPSQLIDRARTRFLNSHNSAFPGGDILMDQVTTHLENEIDFLEIDQFFIDFGLSPVN